MQPPFPSLHHVMHPLWSAMHVFSWNGAPRGRYMPNAAELLLQGNGRYFTYISEECFDREWPDFDYSRLIGAPYMAHIHWHRGSNHLLTETNISDLVQQKKYTALVSAKFRDYDIRFALRDHCAARNESCLVRPCLQKGPL